MLVQRDRMYINFVDGAVRQAQRAISSPIPPAGTYQEGAIYQLIVYGDGAEAALRQLPGCKMSRWNDHAVDILPRSGGKVLGIGQFLRRLSLDWSEIMAFGDGENDVDMLRRAGVGVPVVNRHDTHGCPPSQKSPFCGRSRRFLPFYYHFNQ